MTEEQNITGWQEIDLDFFTSEIFPVYWKGLLGTRNKILEIHVPEGSELDKVESKRFFGTRINPIIFERYNKDAVEFLKKVDSENKENTLGICMIQRGEPPRIPPSVKKTASIEDSLYKLYMAIYFGGETFKIDDKVSSVPAPLYYEKLGKNMVSVRVWKFDFWYRVINTYCKADFAIYPSESLIYGLSKLPPI